MRGRACAVVFFLLSAGALHCGARRRPTVPRIPSDMARAPNGEAIHAVAIAVGRGHACARTAEGKVLCWGANTSGQLGDGTRISRPRPVAVAGLDDADMLVTGDEHTCARRARDQSLLCWGQNAHGELGDGTTDGRPTPAVVTDLHAVLSVSAAGHMTCARKPNRYVLCWGEVHEGSAVKAPSPVFGMTETEEVATGALHACARLADPASGRNVRCWGSNRLRQLGVPHLVDRGMPVDVPHLEKVTQLAAGREHTCARTEEGSVRCWGGGLRCVPGDWFEGKRVAVKPGAIPGMENVSLVASGADQACAILPDTTVACAREKSATGDRSCVSAPIASLRSVTALALGEEFSCALKRDGTVWCWSKNEPPTPVLQQ
ncbi:hypothetical protein LZC95_52935 [Pendulispora brunnea]|uniref:Uncharacterized protein n=1 Tax=Pendulispora brunnea TaxID=2905690 RepID=A0ABZ2K8U4_9BACT